MLVEEVDGGEGLPAGEDFEFGEGEGDFGFVVGVSEVVGVAVVEFGCEGLGGVDLEGEGFGDGEDLGECWSEWDRKGKGQGEGYFGEVGELAAELVDDFVTEENVFVFVNNVFQGFARAEEAGGKVGVVAEPELRVGFVMLDAEVGVGFGAELGGEGVAPRFTPGVVVAGAGELKNAVGHGE